VDNSTIAEGKAGFLLIELTEIRAGFAKEGLLKDILCGVGEMGHSPAFAGVLCSCIGLTAIGAGAFVFVVALLGLG